MEEFLISESGSRRIGLLGVSLKRDKTNRWTV